MSVDPPSRKRIRWEGYDYRVPAYYFVSICTADRQVLLSRIDGDATVTLLSSGQAATDVWSESSGRYPVVSLAFMVMPDDIHGIVGIEPSSEMPTLGAVLGAFKSLSWRRVRDLTGNADPLWQRGYHDRVIRSSAELDRIGAYIGANPGRWLADRRESATGTPPRLSTATASPSAP